MEYEEIVRGVEESSGASTSVFEVFKQGKRRDIIFIQGSQISNCDLGNLAPFLISLSLMVGQQLSGMNAVMFYAVDIFNDAGSGLKSIYANIIIAIVQVLKIKTVFFADNKCFPAAR